MRIYFKYIFNIFLILRMKNAIYLFSDILHLYLKGNGEILFMTLLQFSLAEKIRVLKVKKYKLLKIRNLGQY